MDIQTFLNQDEQKDILRFLTAGSVDDGKSTLIGRLLYDSKLLYEDQLSSLHTDSKRKGSVSGEIDYALLLDGLKAEREQGITIDVAYRYFSTSNRKFIIADTPGHEQYTRNMVTGASTASLAIILIDARTGVITQTKRHSFIVSLLGIRHVIVAVNKMDLVEWDETVFNDIIRDYKDFITRLDIPDVQFIPLSALKGDNVVDKSPHMPWYSGRPILETLETIHITSDRNFIDFRFPVQIVNRPHLDFRGFSGQVASGIIRTGDEVMVLPSRKHSKVKELVTADGNLEYAFPPQSVTVTLEDEIDISRGDMLVHPHNIPRVERQFEAMLVWMSEEPLGSRTNFLIKQTSQLTRVRIDEIRYKMDVNTLHKMRDADGSISQASFNLNEIGRVVLTAKRPLYFDPYSKNRSTGSFIIIDPMSNNTVAVGMIIDRLNQEDLPSRLIANAQSGTITRSLITPEERVITLGQKAMTYWFTGLHGSGKQELAYALERRLFDDGKICVVLDGTKVRAGLSRELDYSKADRAEHLRRVAEMAKLLNEHGIIVIASFISPSNDLREQMKQIIGAEKFRLIHVDTPLETCIKQDRTGLYQKNADGLAHNIPGVDFNYDIPENSDLRLNPNGRKISEMVDLVLAI